jgi:hypothetical protein
MEKILAEKISGNDFEEEIEPKALLTVSGAL